MFKLQTTCFSNQKVTFVFITNINNLNATACYLWKSKTRVTSSNPRVASSDSQVASKK